MTPPIGSSFLKDCDHRHGGKARNLAWLISEGFNVPEGIAYTPAEVIKLIEPKYKASKAMIDSLTKWVRQFNATDQFVVRSSAIAEDGSQKSYAGIFESILAVPRNIRALVNAVRKVVASEHVARAKDYAGADRRNNVGSVGVIIQLQVKAFCAGVVFTDVVGIDGNTRILLEAVYGTADSLVSGKVTPCRYSYSQYSNGPELVVRGTNVLNFNPEQLFELAKIVREKYGKPADIEWASDSAGRISVVQVRPVTKTVFETLSKRDNSGVTACPGVAIGPAYNLPEGDDTGSQMPNGSILIAGYTDTDTVPAMSRAAGIVSEIGGMLCHAAIVAREMDKPCIVGVKDARTLFQDGEIIRLDATNSLITRVEEQPSATVRIAQSKVVDFDFEALYVFDNLLPINLDGVPVLVEPTLREPCVHIPPNLDDGTIERLHVAARKSFGQPVTVTQSNKYLWYYELRRFEKFPSVARAIDILKNAVETTNHTTLESEYVKLEQKALAAVKYMELKDVFIQLAAKELAQALFFVGGLMIPEGYGYRSTFRELTGLMHRKGIGIGTLLAQGWESQDLTHNELAQLKILRFLISKRNTLYEQLRGDGALSSDYFEERELLVVDCLEQLRVKKNSGDIDSVYESTRYLDAMATVDPTSHSPRRY